MIDDGSGRSWLDIYTQHIADEPLNENKTSWEGLARQVKQAAPDIRIIEAYRSSSYDPALIDILVPQLDEFVWESIEQCQPDIVAGSTPACIPGGISQTVT